MKTQAFQMNFFYLVRISLLSAVSLLVIFFFNGCSKGGGGNGGKDSDPTPKVTVNIASLSVMQGSYNTGVTITGTGFDVVANEQVFFNGKQATILTASPTSIYAYVPLAAGTGKVTVTVNGTTATGPVFTYVPALIVTRFAGSITNNAGNTNGTGTAALFNRPSDIAIDKNGNLYVADLYNYVIRKITPQGVVTTFAGTGSQGRADGTTLTAMFEGTFAVKIDQLGNLYIVDSTDLREITADGKVKTISVGDESITDMGIALDGSNNLYVLPNAKRYIFKLTPGGVLTQINLVGSPLNMFEPFSMAVDKSGNLLFTDYDAIDKVSLPDGNFSFASGHVLGGESGIAVDSKGNAYIACTDDYCIKKLTPDGTITVFAGISDRNDGQLIEGLATTVTFKNPIGIAIDASDNIFVTDGNEIKKISVQ